MASTTNNNLCAQHTGTFGGWTGHTSRTVTQPQHPDSVGSRSRAGSVADSVGSRNRTSSGADSVGSWNRVGSGADFVGSWNRAVSGADSGTGTADLGGASFGRPAACTDLMGGSSSLRTSTGIPGCAAASSAATGGSAASLAATGGSTASLAATGGAAASSPKT